MGSYVGWVGQITSSSPLLYTSQATLPKNSTCETSCDSSRLISILLKRTSWLTALVVNDSHLCRRVLCPGLVYWLRGCDARGRGATMHLSAVFSVMPASPVLLTGGFSLLVQL